MPLAIDLREHYLFKKGVDIGAEKERAKARAEQLIEKYQQAKKWLLFGIKPSDIATIMKIPLEKVLEIKKELEKNKN